MRRVREYADGDNLIVEETIEEDGDGYCAIVERAIYHVDWAGEITPISVEVLDHPELIETCEWGEV